MQIVDFRNSQPEDWPRGGYNGLSPLAVVCWSGGVYEIPNSKHQITNKSQIPISNDQNMFGILNFGSAFGGLFVCYLRFVIWNFLSL
jgi:hypothetical protein